VPNNKDEILGLVERQLVIARAATETAFALLQQVLDASETEARPTTTTPLPEERERQPVFRSRARSADPQGDAPDLLPPADASGLIGGAG
jgi:hypothetical protein